MSSNDPLASLRVSKLPELSQRARILLASLHRFASDDFKESENALVPHGTWAETRASAHQLAGVLSTLGFEQSGRLAVELEDIVAGTLSPDPEVLAHLVGLASGIVEGLELHG
jgi:hypothetical protein